MSHPRFVDVTDLDGYSDTRESQAVIPELVYKLVRRAAPDLSQCRIPFGNAINQPGWDGLVETAEGFLPFVPRGRSCWEIGTGDKPEKKATDVYRDRTSQAGSDDRATMTFVFVTPRSCREERWTLGDQTAWKANRANDGWKHIQIIDGTLLAQWLDDFPAVGRWFLSAIGKINRISGLSTPEDHWKNLQVVPDAGDPPLPCGVFLAARDIAVERVMRVLRGELQQVALMVEDPQAALDFVAALLASLDPQQRDPLSERCLFLSEPDCWNWAAELKAPHVLVADSKLDLASAGQQLLLSARRNGHGC